MQYSCIFPNYIRLSICVCGAVRPPKLKYFFFFFFIRRLVKWCLLRNISTSPIFHFSSLYNPISVSSITCFKNDVLGLSCLPSIFPSIIAVICLYSNYWLLFAFQIYHIDVWRDFPRRWIDRYFRIDGFGRIDVSVDAFI